MDKPQIYTIFPGTLGKSFLPLGWVLIHQLTQRRYVFICLRGGFPYAFYKRQGRGCTFGLLQFFVYFFKALMFLGVSAR